MAKVIDYNGIWYQEVAPRSFYDEGDLENAIIQNLEIIFPDFKALLYKGELYDPIRKKNRKPDLAIVKNDYTEWYIIEVELGGHSKEHVVEQVSSFYNCVYSNLHAEFIHKKRPDLDLARLKTMISNHQPDFMVIVNEDKPEWIKDLRSYRCKTCVFQIYQDFEGNPLYRLGGEHPFILTDFCHCKYQKGLTYVVEVLDSQFLDSHGVFDGGKIDVEYKGLSFKWERKDDSNRVFLMCDSSKPPLDPLSDRYRLNHSNANFVKPNATPKVKLWDRIRGKAQKHVFSPPVLVKTFSFTKD